MNTSDVVQSDTLTVKKTPKPRKVRNIYKELAKQLDLKGVK